jgi:hypothetical protein
MAAADAGLTNSGDPHSETIAISISFFTLFSLSYGGQDRLSAHWYWRAGSDRTELGP